MLISSLTLTFDVDAASEQRNPDTFDPSVNIRDYEKIDLPVFTCSSRDYIRLKGLPVSIIMICQLTQVQARSKETENHRVSLVSKRLVSRLCKHGVIRSPCPLESVQPETS